MKQERTGFTEAAGDDRLFGGPGQDQIFGQGGRDWLFGGGGQDLLRVGPVRP